jgi:hypothetical protein
MSPLLDWCVIAIGCSAIATLAWALWQGPAK